MVPLYALMSFLSLLMEQHSVYFSSIRDWCAALLLNLATSEIGRTPAAVAL